MALNLKSFLTRSMSAVVFVIVLLGSLLFRYELFSLFFLVVALIGVKEFMLMAEKLGAKPHKTTVYFCSVLLYLLCMKWNYWFSEFTLFDNFSPLLLLAILPFCFFIVSLFSKAENPIQNALFSMSSIVYAVLPMCFLHELVFTAPQAGNLPMEFNPCMLFGIILLIWSNDTFAYLGGSLFGKRKLIERISPGKTIEGTAFGVFVTFLLSMLLPFFISAAPPVSWMWLGFIIPVMATIGDLIESMLKRSAGIKDSGNILPGHGGVLDRFDSLILVAPVVVLLFKISEF